MRIDASRLVLRPATTEDALCIGVLATQVFLDTYATQGIRAALAREVLGAFSTEACSAFLAAPDTCVHVAQYDGHLIGFLQLSLHATHELAPAGVQAELFRLYVQEPFTGQAVGSALLLRAEMLAAQRGASVLWLAPWAHNRRALAFYAARGYRDCGRILFSFEGEEHENRLLARTQGAQTEAAQVARPE